MPSPDNIDLNIILSFSNHYENLFEKGEITENQLDQILTLLDNFENYSLEELKNKIDAIFEENNLKEENNIDEKNMKE